MYPSTFYPFYYIFNEAIRNIESGDKRKNVNEHKHKDQHGRRESIETRMFTQIKIVRFIIKYCLIYFVWVKSTYYSRYCTVY